MNSKECLKHICEECQIYKGKIKVACPFRSISNEYCDEYETIKKDLEILEIFKDNVMIDEEEKVVTLFLKSKEVVNKIKEWLYE